MTCPSRLCQLFRNSLVESVHIADATILSSFLLGSHHICLICSLSQLSNTLLNISVEFPNHTLFSFSIETIVFSFFSIVIIPLSITILQPRSSRSPIDIRLCDASSNRYASFIGPIGPASLTATLDDAVCNFVSFFLKNSKLFLLLNRLLLAPESSNAREFSSFTTFIAGAQMSSLSSSSQPSLSSSPKHSLSCIPKPVGSSILFNDFDVIGMGYNMLP